MTTLEDDFTVTVPPWASITTWLLPSESESAIVLLSSWKASSRPSSLRTVRTSGVTWVPPSSSGTLSEPHQQPTQIGRETSPASNSTHTPVPTAGTVYTPLLSPAYGVQGSAQPLTTVPRISGTSTFSRPWWRGSLL